MKIDIPVCIWYLRFNREFCFAVFHRCHLFSVIWQIRTFAFSGFCLYNHCFINFDFFVFLDYIIVSVNILSSFTLRSSSGVKCFRKTHMPTVLSWSTWISKFNSFNSNFVAGIVVIYCLLHVYMSSCINSCFSKFGIYTSAHESYDYFQPSPGVRW